MDLANFYPVLQAIESYKARLRASIERTKRRLTEFEQRYDVGTDHFLREMTAEDLDGGDLEYLDSLASGSPTVCFPLSSLFAFSFICSKLVPVTPLTNNEIAIDPESVG